MSMGKKWKGTSLFCLNAKSNSEENIIIYVASEQEYLKESNIILYSFILCPFNYYWPHYLEHL